MGEGAGIGYFLIFCWVATIVITIVLAVRKGYSGFLAFLLGLFIPLLGSLLVIALLPDNNEIEKQNNYIKLLLKKQNIEIEDEVFISSSNELKMCNNCQQMVSIKIKKCTNCGGTDFSQI